MTDGLPAFDELNNIRTTLTEMLLPETAEGTAPVPRIERKRIEDTIFELITMGYVYGVAVAGLDLETDLPVDAERMREVADKPTKGEDFRQRITNHIEAYERGDTDEEQMIERIAVVAETETHRAINTGEDDGARDYAERHPGETIYKTWVTMEDDRVRLEHDLLDGSTIPLDARFYSWNGDSARFPGDFMSPELNINCRCILRYTKS